MVLSVLCALVVGVALGRAPSALPVWRERLARWVGLCLVIVLSWACTPAQGAVSAMWVLKAYNALCGEARPLIESRLSAIENAGDAGTAPAAGGEAMPDAGASE